MHNNYELWESASALISLRAELLLLGLEPMV